MKLNRVTYSHLSVCFVEERLIRTDEDLYIEIHTDEGVLKYTVASGFVSDGRSGGKLLDWLVPHYGHEKSFITFLVHDINFFSHHLSFELSNELCDLMMIWAGYSKFKRFLVRKGLSWFSRFAYDDISSTDRANISKVRARWDAK